MLGFTEDTLNTLPISIGRPLSVKALREKGIHLTFLIDGIFGHEKGLEKGVAKVFVFLGRSCKSPNDGFARQETGLPEGIECGVRLFLGQIARGAHNDDEEGFLYSYLDNIMLSVVALECIEE